MFPYKSSFTLNRSLKEPLYLQLTNQFITYIKSGKLPANTKIIGSRSLANLLSVHRQTVVATYEELTLQGWLISVPKKGTFVPKSLPILNINNSANNHSQKKENTGFNFYVSKVLTDKTNSKNSSYIYINDGTSDTRLTPIIELGKIYRSVTSRYKIHQLLDYNSTLGNEKLRTVLVKYLNETRGLHIQREQILITRGSQMGIWLSAKLLLKEGDIILVGETNYIAADITFLEQKAILKRIPIDENGIVVSKIENLCKKHKIRAIYLTPHHHHPTTVTLSAERRMHLLNLANQYNFAIIEDDYDYDFNYNHAPILPLASHDTNGNVIYIGSICKTVAPVFRIGYLIASKNFVNEAAKVRGIVDRQGDALLELTFAEFIESGNLDRHIRKVLKLYKQRRDFFCKLLKSELNDFFSFSIPKGGMAVWITLNKKYSWEQIALNSKKHHLEIGNWQRYDLGNNNHNSIRIGFASYNIEEIKNLVKTIKLTLMEI